MPRSTKLEKLLSSSLDSKLSLLEAKLSLSKYGEEGFSDEELGLVLSRQLRFEGCGINSSRVTGFMKRFNGMTIDNESGLMTSSGIVIVSAEFSCVLSQVDLLAGVGADRTVQINHYSPDGDDPVTAGIINVNQVGNRHGSLSNVKLFIPANRRLAPLLLGDPNDNKSTFDKPQLHLDYRKVLGTINGN